jgi:hypothetical protein
VLAALLGIHGVDPATASAMPRFRNASAFQIVDRHAYRAVYGSDFPLHTKSSTERKLSVSFQYLDDLVSLCVAKGLAFKTDDRVRFIFDRQTPTRTAA